MNIRSLVAKVRQKKTIAPLTWRYIGEDKDEYEDTMYVFELLYKDRTVYAISVVKEDDEENVIKEFNTIENHFKKEFNL